MKINKFICLIVLSTIMGCAPSAPTTSTDGIPAPISTHDQVVNTITQLEPWIKPATSLACSATLNLALSGQDRIDKANMIYSIAHGVRSIMTGTIPTPAELQATINLWTPDKIHWVELSTNISGIYATIYPQIVATKDVALAMKVLEDIAAGCEGAASAVIGQQ